MTQVFTIQNKEEEDLARLFLRSQAGEEAAYREFLTQIDRRLRRYLRSRLSAYQGDLEDVVQEVLLAIHLRRQSLDPDKSVIPWVMAVVNHKLADFWRHDFRHRAVFINDDTAEPDVAPVLETEHFSTKRDLQYFLAKLPALQRDVLVAVKIEGLSVAEAAQQFGCTEGAIRVYTHRGLRRLEVLLREEHGD